MNRFYEAQQALDRAEETLKETEYNMKGGFTIATVNRAYYTVFYCITALLHTEEIYTKSHSGAQGKFHELFVKTKRFPPESAQWVQYSFQLRQTGDYDLDTEVTEEQAEQALVSAHLFFSTTQTYITDVLSAS